MTKKISITREDALRLDAADPLAHHRGAFDLPDGIYLDGNSLGPLTHASRERVHKCLDEEWLRVEYLLWGQGDCILVV
ncbi:MAG: kynureninase, partial [Pseudomonadota bacterium]